MCVTFIIQLSVCRLIGCFHFLTVVERGAMTDGQVSLETWSVCRACSGLRLMMSCLSFPNARTMDVHCHNQHAVSFDLKKKKRFSEYFPKVFIYILISKDYNLIFLFCLHIIFVFLIMNYTLFS